MRTDMTDRFERFSIALFNISHYWNRIAAEEMKKHSLKGAYALYLITIYNHSEEITASKLAELCKRDKADVSRAVTSFQNKGIAEPYGPNRYRAPIRLTEYGKDVARQVKDRADLALEAAGRGMDDEMRAHMYQCLDIIAFNMKEISEKGLKCAMEKV